MARSSMPPCLFTTALRGPYSDSFTKSGRRVVHVCPDPYLSRLILHHLQLQQELAPVLKRVGAHHPDRHKVNARRAKARKAARSALRQSAQSITARCIEV